MVAYIKVEESMTGRRGRIVQKIESIHPAKVAKMD